jgi:16S rRNA (cytidine1402-2'-O)-methyltransferase
MLYLVPTPIGNLGDLTYRAGEVLSSADKILAEDTRQAKKLLRHYEIDTAVESFHMHNEHRRLNGIVEQLQSGMEIAQISDAGMPGISDPGYLLVRACVENNIPLTVLPGASAFLPALVASGLPCDRFYFEGFLPPKKGKNKRIQYLSQSEETVVLYESPHKIVKTLRRLIEFLGADRAACLARELTKLHEEFIRGSLEEICTELESRSKIKGEITLVIEGKKK